MVSQLGKTKNLKTPLLAQGNCDILKINVSYYLNLAAVGKYVADRYGFG